MTKLKHDLERLHDRILRADPELRRRLLPQLGELIARMDAEGVAVPAGIRDLCEELTNAAIEAQFDNMPV